MEIMGYVKTVTVNSKNLRDTVKTSSYNLQQNETTIPRHYDLSFIVSEKGGVIWRRQARVTPDGRARA